MYWFVYLVVSGWNNKMKEVTGSKNRVSCSFAVKNSSEIFLEIKKRTTYFFDSGVSTGIIDVESDWEASEAKRRRWN